MKVLSNYVIVEETTSKAPQQTEGGLLLAESHRDDLRYREGSVKNPGDKTVGVKEGDNILFDGNAGYKLPYPLDKYKVIREGDIVVIL